MFPPLGECLSGGPIGTALSAELLLLFNVRITRRTNGDVKVAVIRTRMYTAPPLNRDIVYLVTQDPLVLILPPGTTGGLFLNGGIEVETTVCP